LVESLLLSVAGGTAGYLLAFWTADLAVSVFPFSFGTRFSPDVRVLAYTMLLAVGTAVIFGVVPALLASRTDVATLVKSRDVGLTRSPLRSTLVVGQVAVSIVLVLGAVQFVRSLRTAESVDLGFETENRLLVSVNLTNHGYSLEERHAFVVQALERLKTLPGVLRATTTLFTPFRGRWTSSIREVGTDDIEEQRKEASFNSVSPGYFKTMGVPLLTGRDFSLRDRDDAPLVAVMNEAAADMMWSGEERLGRVFMIGDDRVRVIGIARNANYYELGEDPQPLVFVSALQPIAAFTGRVSFLLQTAAEPMAVAKSAQNELHSIDPNLAFSSVQTMGDCVERVLGQYRVGATIVSLLGMLALVLAMVGLYGVLSYLVLRRMRSLGIQMALGATRGRVALGVVAQGLKLSLLGIATGIPAATGAARFVEGLLYGIEPKDPVTFVSVPMALVLVASVACLLPALRASRVNPVDALREE
jgi:predicted permease